MYLRGGLKVTIVEMYPDLETCLQTFFSKMNISPIVAPHFACDIMSRYRRPVTDATLFARTCPKKIPDNRCES